MFFTHKATMIILIPHFISFLYVDLKISKRKLELNNFINPALQSAFATSLLSHGLNIFYWGLINDYDFPPSLFPTVWPFLEAGLLLLALWLYVVYENISRSFLPSVQAPKEYSKD